MEPPSDPLPDDVTELLRAWSDGDPEALNRLLPRIMSEVRSLARRLLALESKDNTLQPTELVHEAYLRLVDRKTYAWKDRVQFLSLLAEVMRRVLIDRARKRRAAKRGGGAQPLTLDEGVFARMPRDPILLLLDDALKILEAEDPRKYKIVTWRYFVGLTQAEIARELGISVNTVNRHWTAAKLWLEQEMRAASEEPAGEDQEADDDKKGGKE